jgi:hypothetical protein
MIGLAPGLRKLYPVHLNLAGGQSGPQGMAAFCQSLVNVNRLSFLSLSSNNLGPEGSAALGAILRNAPHLKRLDVLLHHPNDIH